MRILNRTQFLALPPGVVFAKYTPIGVFGTLCMKDDTVTDLAGADCDFWHQDLTSEVESEDSATWLNILETSEAQGTSFDLDFNCAGRDGLRDAGQLFAVWEKEDLDGLRTLLGSCIGMDEV